MSPPLNKIQLTRYLCIDPTSTENTLLARFSRACTDDRLHVTGYNGRSWDRDVLPFAEQWLPFVNIDEEYFVAFYEEYGAWDEDELRALSPVEKLGLFMQDVYLTLYERGDTAFYYEH